MAIFEFIYKKKISKGTELCRVQVTSEQLKENKRTSLKSLAIQEFKEATFSNSFISMKQVKNAKY